MRKIISVIFLLGFFMYVSAQKEHTSILYKGYKYYFDLNSEDSTIRFRPVDKNKVGKDETNVKTSAKLKLYPLVPDTSYYNANYYRPRLEYIQIHLNINNEAKDLVSDFSSLEKKHPEQGFEEDVFRAMCKCGYSHKEDNQEAYKQSVKANENHKFTLKFLQLVSPLFFDMLDSENNQLNEILNSKNPWRSVIGTEFPEPVLPDHLEDGRWTHAQDTLDHTVRVKNPVFIDNPILADTFVIVNNPDYKGEGYKEWKWLDDLDFLFYHGFDETFEHINRTFPKEEHYYIHKQRPDLKFYSGDYWFCCDSLDNLIWVQDKHSYDDGGQITSAVIYSEFENNKYNIQSEPKETQQWVSYLLNKKKGRDIYPNLDSDAFSVTLGLGSIYSEIDALNKKLMLGKISKSYYRQEINNCKQRLARATSKANGIMNKYPSKENQERAEKYVNQLEMDYDIKYGDSGEDEDRKQKNEIHRERLNGTQILFVNTDRSLKVLKTYTLDNNRQLKASYTLLKKE